MHHSGPILPALKLSSIGLRCGEYGGRKTIRQPNIMNEKLDRALLKTRSYPTILQSHVKPPTCESDNYP